VKPIEMATIERLFHPAAAISLARPLGGTDQPAL